MIAKNYLQLKANLSLATQKVAVKQWKLGSGRPLEHLELAVVASVLLPHSYDLQSHAENQ